ncbi:MAG: GNAT family N-acetyltransferase [Chitinophagales bacterium]
MLGLRRYEPADYPSVQALHVLGLKQAGAYHGEGPWDDDLRAIEASYLTAGGDFLVGCEDGQLVAMGALRPTTRNLAEVKRMRVHPAYQGRGYGQLLLDRLEARARELGYSRLHLETSAAQAAALSLYRKNGYREIWRAPLRGSDCFFFEKDLGEADETGEAGRVMVMRAEECHLPGILEIYNDAVFHSTATFDTEPKTLADRQAWLTGHGDAYPVIVAVEDGQVLAWGSLSPFSDRPAYCYTVEDSLYVRPEVQGRGLGSRLLERLLALGVMLGYRAVLAKIVDENAPSLGVHRKFGFVDAGLLRAVGYKFGRWLDVSILQRSFGY